MLLLKPMRNRPEHLCVALAEVAELQLNESVCCELVNEEMPLLDGVEPFFESLGAWNADTRTIRIFKKRCVLAAGRFLKSVQSVYEVVLRHFCAHAVAHLGVYPNSSKNLASIFNPQHAFKHEAHTPKPAHHHYDNLIRDEELFAQIFSYVLILQDYHPEERRFFQQISRGHEDLYSLSPERHVNHLLRQDWRAQIEGDPKQAAEKAAFIFKLIAGVVPPREPTSSL
jgi:hypothetical protein